MVAALKKSGIKKGDVIFVHVNLGAFGKLGLIKNKYELTNLFIEAFLQAIGKRYNYNPNLHLFIL